MRGELSKRKQETIRIKTLSQEHSGAGKTVDIDFLICVWKKGDIILMCTDGLSNMVEDENMRSIFKRFQKMSKAGRC